MTAAAIAPPAIAVTAISAAIPVRNRMSSSHA
jgi:hypothetical protein